ncbi:helix-turn-helix domain-containing protein [Streptomyces sp. NPDC056831]|uniref:helix-turn-helix domain-containing protein n=1 Tax=Streptomyces sp. NPDC056831 TaxID=3345954 RepID=UPI003689F4A0
MKADMGRRYRLYPTIVQEQVLTGWGHTARALWGVALAQRVHVYEQRGLRPDGSAVPQGLRPTVRVRALRA